MARSPLDIDTDQLERYALAPSHERLNLLRQHFPPGNASRLYFEGLHAVMDGQHSAALQAVEELRRRTQPHASQLANTLEAATELYGYDGSTASKQKLQSYLMRGCDGVVEISDDPPQLEAAAAEEIQKLRCELTPADYDVDAFINAMLPILKAENFETVDAITAAMLLAASQHGTAYHSTIGAEHRLELLKAVAEPANVADVVSIISDYINSFLDDAKMTELGMRMTSVLFKFPVYNKLTLEQLQTLGNAVVSCKRSIAWQAAVVRRACACDTEDVESMSHDAKMAVAERALRYADSMGDSARWVKLRVLHAKLTWAAQHGSMDVAALASMLKMLPHIDLAVWRTCSRALARSPPSKPPADEHTPHFGVDVDDDIGPLFPKVRSVTLQTLKTWVMAALTACGDNNVFGDAGALRGLLRDCYERAWLSEHMLLSGCGNADAWARSYEHSDMGLKVKDLQDLVILQFAATNSISFATSTPVRLTVDVKNVPVMLVRVYDIDLERYYRSRKQEIGTDIKLEGLGATREFNIAFEQSPMIKHQHVLELDELAARGCWVVDVVGGGKSARALVQKGGLRVIERTSVAGHAFTVLYENNEKVASDDCCAWLNNKQYKCNDRGEIIIPYSSTDAAAAGSSSVDSVLIVSDGRGAALRHTFSRMPETYKMQAGFFVDRQALVPRTVATLMVAASLSLHGAAAPLSLLRDVALHVTATDVHGTTVTQVVQDFKLSSNGELSQHSLRVPDHARKLQVSLTARVQLACAGSDGSPQFRDLSVEQNWTVNAFDDSNAIHDVFLTGDGNSGYILQVLGRGGEAAGCSKRVNVRLLSHVMRLRDAGLQFALRCDDDGVITLGHLRGIACVVAEMDGVTRSWHLTQPNAHQHIGSITANANRDTIRLRVPPWLACCDDKQRATACSMVQTLRTGSHDVLQCLTAHMSFTSDNYITLPPLPCGEYRIAIGDVTCDLHVHDMAGMLESGGRKYWMSKHSMTTPTVLHPLQVSALRVTAQHGVSMQLHGSADQLQRCSIALAFSRFIPSTTTPRESLAAAAAAAVMAAEPAMAVQWRDRGNVFVCINKIDDEVRYVYERKQKVHRRWYGSLLDKPSLLVHRRAARDTSNVTKDAAGGDEFERKEARAAQRTVRYKGGPTDYGAECGYRYTPTEAAYKPTEAAAPYTADVPFSARAALHDISPSFNFVKPSVLVLNCQLSSSDGSFHITPQQLRQLGCGLDNGYTYCQVVVIPRKGKVVAATALTEGSVPPQRAPVRDVATQRPLASSDRDGLCVQARRVAVLQPRDTLCIADASSAKIKIYDTLQDAWLLFGTLLKTQHVPGFTPSHAAASDMWQKFSWLPTWHSMSRDEKLRHVDEHACYELFFFVKMKDKPFFEQEMKAALQSKCDSARRFMDAWLCDDVTAMLRWHAPHRYRTLNTLETILLACHSTPQTLERLSMDIQQRCEAAARSMPAKHADTARRLHDVATAVASLSADAVDLAAPAAAAAAPLREYEVVPQMQMLAAAPAFGAAPSVLFGAAAPRQLKSVGAAAPPPPAPAASASRFVKLGGGGYRDGSEDSDAEDDDSGTDVGGTYDGGDDGDDAACYDIAQRAKRLQYRGPATTKEWVEARWWQQEKHSDVNDATRIIDSLFWSDYACHLLRNDDTPFLSEHLAEAARTGTEAVMCLAVLGLSSAAPSNGAAHDVQYEGLSLTLTAAMPAIVFHKSIIPAADDDDDGKADGSETAQHAAAASSAVLVAQRLFDVNDRYVIDDTTGERVEKDVGVHLRTARAYGSQTFITNCSCNALSLDVLLQVPHGAIALAGKPSMHVQQTTLQPYHCVTLEMLFYFPRAGVYKQCAASVVRSGKLMWRPQQHLPALDVSGDDAAQQDLNASKFSWLQFSCTASDEEVLEYLKTGDLTRAQPLQYIAWRCASQTFFSAAVAALRGRHVFDDSIWRYAVRHMDDDALREYLAAGYGAAATLRDTLGSVLEAPLLPRTAMDVGLIHKEYAPLINARVHPLAGGSATVNTHLTTQWRHFLEVAAHRRELSRSCLLQAVHYMLTMDRCDDAHALLRRADALERRDGGEGAMQQDYMHAWLLMSLPNATSDDLTRVRSICDAYRAVTQQQWRQRFDALSDTLQQLQRGPTAAPSEGDGEQKSSAAAQRQFDVDAADIARGIVTLQYSSVASVTVAAYVMDVELLFSRRPFAAVHTSVEDCTFVRPQATLQRPLPADEDQIALDVNEMFPDLVHASVLFVFNAGGTSRSVSRYSGAKLVVRVFEELGMLQVATPAPNAAYLAGAYVKVFARHADGSSRFHKDGYTDRCGRFDYALVTTKNAQTIEQFALLIVSDDHGCVVRQAAPPPLVGEV